MQKPVWEKLCDALKDEYELFGLEPVFSAEIFFF